MRKVTLIIKKIIILIQCWILSRLDCMDSPVKKKTKDNLFLYKHNMSFICIDVVDIYPSITESLLNKALDFANKYTHVDVSEIAIITGYHKLHTIQQTTTMVKLI